MLPNNTSATSAAEARIPQQLILENKTKSGLNWFYWIAALSLVNSVSFLFGASLTFVIGLGATQFVDGLVSALSENLPHQATIVRPIGLAINVFIAGLFALFGYLGRKGFRSFAIIGMILYLLDGILLLLFKDYLGAAFHAWALFGIWGGLKALTELKQLRSVAQ